MTGTLALLQQLSQEELRKQILKLWSEADETWVIPIELMGVDLSIDKRVWFLFIGTALTFIIMFIGSRLLKDRPGAYQVIVEELYGFGRNHLGGQMGEEGRKWFPYTLSIFVFLLVLNLMSLIPDTYPVTSNISFTATLALITFFITQFEGFRRNGAGGYLKSWVPAGLPQNPSKFVLVPFMWLIHLVGELNKPFTLALRLYANILAGHLVILVFLSLILYFGTITAVVSVPAAIAFYGFEVFIAVIQAYIFAILTQVYIELAMFGEESH